MKKYDFRVDRIALVELEEHMELMKPLTYNLLPKSKPRRGTTLFYEGDGAHVGCVKLTEDNVWEISTVLSTRDIIKRRLAIENAREDGKVLDISAALDAVQERTEATKFLYDFDKERAIHYFDGKYIGISLGWVRFIKESKTSGGMFDHSGNYIAKVFDQPKHYKMYRLGALYSDAGKTLMMENSMRNIFYSKKPTRQGLYTAYFTSIGRFPSFATRILYDMTILEKVIPAMVEEYQNGPDLDGVRIDALCNLIENNMAKVDYKEKTTEPEVEYKSYGDSLQVISWKALEQIDISTFQDCYLKREESDTEILKNISSGRIVGGKLYLSILPGFDHTAFMNHYTNIPGLSVVMKLVTTDESREE